MKLFSPDEEAWLRAEYSKSTIAETTRRFNETFGRKITCAQMQNANKRCRFGRANRRVRRLITPGEEAWLREHFASAPRAKIRDRFAETFGKTLSLSQLDNLGVRLDLRGAPNTGRFRTGHAPANKGRKGWCPPGSEKTWFKKGHQGTRTKPMFSERWLTQSDGSKVLEIKIPEGSYYPSMVRKGWHQRSRWIRKAVWVWRQANGDVPEGHAILQLDGDPSNCDLENLECVPKSVLARLNHRNAPKFAGSDINAVRIRIAQIRDQVAKRGRSKSPPAGIPE